MAPASLLTDGLLGVGVLGGEHPELPPLVFWHQSFRTGPRRDLGWISLSRALGARRWTSLQTGKEKEPLPKVG